MKNYQLKKILVLGYRKIVRADGSPEYIARGWAIGVFIGCAIPMGIQLAVSIPLSFPLRGSKIGASLGTLISNPVSVVLLYPAQCWLGNKLIGGELSYRAVRSVCSEAVIYHDWGSVLAMGEDLIVSFFVGGLVFAIIATPIAYFVVYLLVVRYRRLKEAIKSRRQKSNEEKTSQN